jgi:hypothetical protein
VTDEAFPLQKNVMTPYPGLLLENVKPKITATIDKVDLEEYSLYLILGSFTNTCGHI